VREIKLRIPQLKAPQLFIAVGLLLYNGAALFIDSPRIDTATALVVEGMALCVIGFICWVES